MKSVFDFSIGMTAVFSLLLAGQRVVQEIALPVFREAFPPGATVPPTTTLDPDVLQGSVPVLPPSAAHCEVDGLEPDDVAVANTGDTAALFRSSDRTARVIVLTGSPDSATDSRLCKVRLLTIDGIRSDVTDVAIDPDGTSLYVAALVAEGGDVVGQIDRYTLPKPLDPSSATTTATASLNPPADATVTLEAGVYSLAFSSDGATVYAASDGVETFDPESLDLLQGNWKPSTFQSDAHLAKVAITRNDDGREVAVLMGSSGQIMAVRTDTWDLVDTYTCGSSLQDIAARGDLVAVVGPDCFQILKLNGNAFRRFKTFGPEDGLSSLDPRRVALTAGPDPLLIVAGGERLADPKRGSEGLSFEIRINDQFHWGSLGFEPSKPVTALATSPDGLRLATSAARGLELMTTAN